MSTYSLPFRWRTKWIHSSDSPCSSPSTATTTSTTTPLFEAHSQYVPLLNQEHTAILDDSSCRRRRRRILDPPVRLHILCYPFKTRSLLQVIVVRHSLTAGVKWSVDKVATIVSSIFYYRNFIPLKKRIVGCMQNEFSDPISSRITFSGKQRDFAPNLYP